VAGAVRVVAEHAIGTERAEAFMISRTETVIHP